MLSSTQLAAAAVAYNPYVVACRLSDFESSAAIIARKKGRAVFDSFLVSIGLKANTKIRCAVIGQLFAASLIGVAGG